MRILAKNSIINKLSLSPTISRFSNTFFIVCIDDKSKIQFFKHIAVLKHSSFLSFFDFSDSYVCFLNIDEFINQLKMCLMHIKPGEDDGTNLFLGYIYEGIFLNIYNPNLINFVANVGEHLNAKHCQALS